MCTTDPQKILATILSRVPLTSVPIAADGMAEHLVNVCKNEATYEDAAIDLIVRHARGGMRGTPSLLLNSFPFYGGGVISEQTVRDVWVSRPALLLTMPRWLLATQRDISSLFYHGKHAV